MQKLLEMVERRGPLALSAFQEAIEENYPHLYVLISDWDAETEDGNLEYDMYSEYEAGLGIGHGSPDPNMGSPIVRAHC